ncbi:hypothetical protein CDIK_1607 [Cucumispora dikerogammari]|nr:hypothetical protein CDIK_1607 [Cucumispora dikerogammari]
MGGVDLSAQMIKNYNTYRKTKRRVYKMTLFLFECCLNNSYRCLPFDILKTTTHSEFREGISKHLMKYSEAVFPETNKNPVNFKKHLIVKLETRRRCSFKENHLGKVKDTPLTSWVCENCKEAFCFPDCFQSNNDSIYLEEVDFTSTYSYDQAN